MNIRVDFTPMVDMNMLLITFFMLCTSLSKPQTMEISMPSNDKRITEEQQTKVKASQAITFLLASGNRLFYYEGEPAYEEPASLKETTYGADGARAMLLQRNARAVAQVNELKRRRQALDLTDEAYKERLAEVKGGKENPTVIIKPTDQASYANLIDLLDEMQVCSIGRYVITDLTEGDQQLLAAAGSMDNPLIQ